MSYMYQLSTLELTMSECLFAFRPVILRRTASSFSLSFCPSFHPLISISLCSPAQHRASCIASWHPSAAIAIVHSFIHSFVCACPCAPLDLSYSVLTCVHAALRRAVPPPRAIRPSCVHARMTDHGRGRSRDSRPRPRSLALPMHDMKNRPSASGRSSNGICLYPYPPQTSVIVKTKMSLY